MANDYFASKGWLTKYAKAEDSTGAWQKYVAEVQRSEMDNFNTPDLDQGADSILRPGETLEDDFDVTFRKPNAEGGRQGFKDGLDVSDVYNESTGHIYKKGNRFKTVYSKTPTLNQHEVNLRDPKYTDEVIKFIDENPTFNQKQGAKILGKQRAELVNYKLWGNPGPKWDDEKVKIRAKKKKQWTDKYSKSDIQSKLSGSDGLDYHHAGGKRELVSTGNTMYLDSEINRKKIQKFERALNKIQEQQYQTELNRNMPIEEKRKIFDDLKKQENVLRKKYPDVSDFKSSLVFEETALSPKTNFMKKEVMPNEALTISEGKTGQKLTLKGKKIDSSEGKKIIELSKKSLEAKKEVLNQNLGTLGCPKGLPAASGGRIKFSKGSSCVIKGRKRLEQIILKGGGNKVENSLAEGILKAGKGLKGVFALKGLLGPAALAFEAALESGFVSYDMLSKGKTFKEAIGDSLFNYALGDKTKIDSRKERDKRFRTEGMSEEEMGKIAAFENALQETGQISNMYDKLETAEQGQLDSMGYDSNFSQFPDQTDFFKKQEDEARADLQDVGRTGSIDRLMNVDYTGGATALAEANRRAELAQLQSVDNIFQSGKGDKKRSIRKKELMLKNPDILNYMGSYPAEHYGFAEGGLAGLMKKYYD
jgi:hypothetical protein